jgi:hypothetical protein
MLFTLAISVKCYVDLGTVRRAPVSLRADRIRPHNHLPKNSALRAVGHGATNTAAAFRITLVRIRTHPLNVPRAGIGRPTPIVVRSRISTHPRLPTNLVHPAAKRMNSGMCYALRYHQRLLKSS